MLRSQVIHHYVDTYVEGIGKDLIVFNTLSQRGVLVLDEPAAFIFKLVDNKKTAADIYEKAKKKDPSVIFADIERILLDFSQKEIVYLDKPKLSPPKGMPAFVSLAVWFHLTNQCNLRCKYCYVPKNNDSMPYDLATKTITKLLRDTKKHGGHHIEINFAGGECLLQFGKLMKLVGFGKSQAENMGMKISFVIITNGVLLTDAIAKTLKENNIKVIVSVDGLDEYHDSQRIFTNGSGSFKYVARGLEHLVNNGISPRINVTITKYNVKNMPELTKFLLEKKCTINFGLVRDSFTSGKSPRASMEDLFKYLKKSYQLIAEKHGKDLNVSDFLNGINFNGPGMVKCRMGHSYITVKHDGNIVSCPMNFTTNIGTIRDKDIIQTIQKGNFIRPRGLSVDGKTKCGNCQWKYHCKGGCPLDVFLATGSYYNPSPYCEAYRRLIPEIIKLQAKKILLQHA